MKYQRIAQFKRPFRFIMTAVITAAVFCSSAYAEKRVPQIQVGAQSVDEYIPLLKGSRVCLLSNQSGIVPSGKHDLDILLENGIDVVLIMTPEHGFRGNVDAGETLDEPVDPKTGVPICSLYSRTGAPIEFDREFMNGFDILVFDLQDVGVRFYTYYVTMKRMMEVCAEFGKKMIILDRPNPIGFLVDGPKLDMKYKSAAAALPIPVAHGMTLGELAGMINGEKWLDNGLQCDITVIKCKNYTHQSRYTLPVKPSPNIPDMRSVYLYPSMCYFEATPVSLGRGTDWAFQMYGHPNMKGYDFEFTPRSTESSHNPIQKDKTCYGVDLRTQPSDEEILANGVNLEYLIDAYNNLNLGDHFFRPAFEILMGQGYVRRMIEAGATAEQIKACWAKDVEDFKRERRPYLLYPEY